MSNRIARAFGLATAALVVAASAQAQGRNSHDDRDHRPGPAPKPPVARNDHRDDHRDDRNHPIVIRQDRNDHNDRFDHRDDRRDNRNNREVVVVREPARPMPMPRAEVRRYPRYEPAYGANVLADQLRRQGYRVVRVVDRGNTRYVYYQPVYGYNNRGMAMYGPEQYVLVREGADRLYFDNAPQNILQAVMAQLY